MSDSKLLQFVPFSSALDAGFWYQLSERKLEVYKLEDKPVSICGFYTNREVNGMPPIANVDYTSFNEDIQVPPRSFPLTGTLLNTNTLEEFKVKDKVELIQSAGKEIWETIKNGTALKDPSLLQTFICLTFADLKKYHYYYWLAFPAFSYPESFACKPVKKLPEYFDSNQTEQFLEGYDTLSASSKIYFLVFVSDIGDVSVSDLSAFDSFQSESGQVFLGFSDPCTLDCYPGWPLRNFLSLAAYTWPEKKSWDVICFRDSVKEGSRFCSHSLVISLEIHSADVPEECPITVGWEKNRNKLVPRMVDMSSAMDPLKLADTAVDLNLKLMKWRLVPELELDDIKNAKCLLLGSGTLGCNVARCLLGWGVRKITLVDNSSVSFSNPVRQSLFNFEDCMHGGKPKSKTAADALKRIFPGVDAEGVLLNIPMPGHGLSDNTIEATRTEVAELEKLIESHDIIFLLMDTRESRWLPTVIGAAKQKIVINSALGFDTFLVMRHGVKGPEIAIPERDPQHPWKIISGTDLGCYFCNDVVAPGNSTRDRTLDQQCTVSRPGISYIAAAVAVELLVGVLQHPKRGGAPATASSLDDLRSIELVTALGIVPHQVRGYMDRFQNIVHVSKAFDRCIACSPKVLENYTTRGFEFLLQVFNEPNYLEDLTGLTDLLNNINVDDILELSDDGST